jgi:hypothetical protein
MTDGLWLFLRRCGRITTAPTQEAEQIVLERARLGGFILGWLVGVPGTLWVGETLWPGWNSMAGYLMVALLAAAVSMLVQTSVLHLASRVLGGRGRWDNMVALFGYAAVPLIALAFILGGGLALYLRAFGPIPFHLAGILMFFLALLAVMITCLVIIRHGLSANYGISRRRAWVVTAVGVLVFALGGASLRGKFVESCAISFANLTAMARTPFPFAAQSGESAWHFSKEYSANLRYYRNAPMGRGEVVIFRGDDGHGWLGRVLGLPGEEVGLQDGHLTVDGVQQPESWKTAGDLTMHPRRLGPNEYFLWTDDRTPNLKLAVESTFQGVVKRERILGPPLRLDAALIGWIFGEPGRDSRRAGS